MPQVTLRPDAPPDPARLAPARLVDSDHPVVTAYAQAHALGHSDRERAVALYGAVRDDFRYDPCDCDLSEHGMQASTVIAKGHGWCVPKATPAFNLGLCHRFGLLPLDFDGIADSIYHPFDAAGNRHMEYVGQRASFNDVPLATLVADFRLHYPHVVVGDTTANGADFLADVDRETRP